MSNSGGEPPEHETEALRRDIQKLRDRVESIERSLSGDSERMVAGAISRLVSGEAPRLPRVVEVLEIRLKHQIQVHGREYKDSWRTCARCFLLEMLYHAATKQASAEPIDLEASG